MALELVLQGGGVAARLALCADEVAEVRLIGRQGSLQGDRVAGADSRRDVGPALVKQLQLGRPSRCAAGEGEFLEGDAERIERFARSIVRRPHQREHRQRDAHRQAELRHVPPRARRLVPGSQEGAGREGVAVLGHDLLADAGDRHRVRPPVPLGQQRLHVRRGGVGWAVGLVVREGRSRVGHHL